MVEGITFNRIQNLKSYLKERPQEISKTNILAWAKERHIEIGFRTLDFWGRQGLLKPARRGADKQAYWSKDYILEEITAIEILTKRFTQPLSILAKLAKETHYNLNIVAGDMLGIERGTLNRYSDERQKNLTGYHLTKVVIDLYAKFMSEGRLKRKKELQRFQGLADEYVKVAIEVAVEVDYSRSLEDQAVKEALGEYRRRETLKKLENF